MKKYKSFIALTLAAIMTVSLYIPSYGAFVQDEISEHFLALGEILFLTEPLKVSEVVNDHTKVMDKDGNDIDENTYIPTGAIVEYYGNMSCIVILMGDVDGSGTINSADARLALRASAKLEDDLSPLAYVAMDIGMKWDIPTASDARRILRISAKLDDFSDCRSRIEEYIEMETGGAEGDYSPDCVLVVLKPEYTGSEQAKDPAFYDSELVASVDDLSGVGIYVLNLAEPSESNVEKLIELLKNNDAVISAGKNYILELI